jgi:alcohol dehydrogenase class IV
MVFFLLFYGDNMQTFEMRKFVAPEFIVGTNVRFLAGQYAHNYGIRKLMIVTDTGVEKAGWVKEIASSLDIEGIKYIIYDKVSENPRDYEVMDASEVYLANECQGLLGIGGGSALDCAKGVGIVATSGKHILEFEGVDKVDVPTPPMICIPTTSGTSSDVSQFAIIRDMQRQVKIAIISKIIVPDVTLIDPLVTTSMDAYVTACTGLDALTHAIEAFSSNGSSVITDNHAMNAMRIIKENLNKAVDSPHDMAARYNMMVGSLEAGLAFSNASLGAVHAMAHSLGGYLNLAHGECNALLLTHVISYNFDNIPERFDKVGEIFDLKLGGMTTKEKKKALLKEIGEFRESVGIHNKLGDLGVKSSDLPILSSNAVLDPCLITNPKSASKADIETIYGEAL